MDVIFAAALLLLAGGIVVLFAMLGELASRVPAVSRTGSIVRDVDGVRLGKQPTSWPPGLPALDSVEPTVVLVLSTVCNSCAEIAEQLPDNPATLDWPDLGLVISAGGTSAGEDFVLRHGLGRYRHVIDEGGTWITDEFAVRTSPVALVLTDATLTAALLFSDVPALRAKLSSVSPQRRKAER